MTCPHKISNIEIRLDKDERLIQFKFTHLRSQSKDALNTEYSKYCRGRTLKEILNIQFENLLNDLDLHNEQQQYQMYLEWDVLRSAIAQYLHIHDEKYDTKRCQIQSIIQDSEETRIDEIILPPKRMPSLHKISHK